jgi:hypothetical protein
MDHGALKSDDVCFVSYWPGAVTVSSKLSIPTAALNGSSASHKANANALISP